MLPMACETSSLRLHLRIVSIHSRPCADVPLAISANTGAMASLSSRPRSKASK